MSSPDVILDIPNREVDWMIFMLASCDGNCCLVTSEYDGNEYCSMCVGIYSNEVLFVVKLVDARILHKFTYTLPPGPVA